MTQPMESWLKALRQQEGEDNMAAGWPEVFVVGGIFGAFVAVVVVLVLRLWVTGKDRQ